MPRGSAPRGRQEREGEERDETTTPPSGSRVSRVGQRGDLSPSAGHLPLVMMAAPSGQDSFSMVSAGPWAPLQPKGDDETAGEFTQPIGVPSVGDRAVCLGKRVDALTVGTWRANARKVDDARRGNAARRCFFGEEQDETTTPPSGFRVSQVGQRFISIRSISWTPPSGDDGIAIGAGQLLHGAGRTAGSITPERG